MIAGLAVVLFIDMLSIPSCPEGVSRIREAILGTPNRRAAVHPLRLRGFAERKGATIEWIWPIEPELEPLMRDSDAERFKVTVVFDLHQRQGFYHLTRRTEGFSVLKPLSGEDQQAVLDALLAAAERDPMYERILLFVPDLIRAGVKQRVVPVYSGYVRNGIAGLLVASLIVCCTLGKPWLWRPAALDPQHRRVRKGLCGNCGYDLTGLPGDVCPECGTPTEREA